VGQAFKALSLPEFSRGQPSDDGREDWTVGTVAMRDFDASAQQAGVSPTWTIRATSEPASATLLTPFAGKVA
jgi:hypothetical protein